MPIITLTTKIKAPIERVFDLSRSIDLYPKSTDTNDEKAVAGKTSGLLEKGEEVTWEGSHLRFRKSLQIRISELTPPQGFTEEMVSGAFARMKHHHRFEADGDETTMIDELDYKSRGGLLGWFVENSFLTAHIRRFLADRNKVIKQVAESDQWKTYL